MTETNTVKLCLTKAGRYLCLLAVVMLIGGALVLRGQDLGSISGTVSDPSGAAVPGAAITVKNSKTGTVVRTTVTNEDGNYTVPALPASTYSLKAERSGFTSAIQSDVILSVHSSIRVDFQLKLGAVNQQVTVTAPAVHLQTETGTVSQSLSARHVEAIDTNGRNFEELAMLVPGAAAVTGMGMSMVGGFNNQVGSLANGSISFNGEEADHTLYTIDGLEDADRGGGGGSVFIPNQDAIGEMKVLTSNMGVDVGFATGGQIQVELKSGTNQFHGEAFEFNRNTAFDASTFFANASNTPKPQFNFNDFGFNIGGPVWIPGHAKKTFFFYSQDFRRLITGAGININGVPTAWTTGDLSSSSTVILNHNAPSTPCQIPGSTTMTTCYQPFANNQITAIDPNAAILAKPGFLFEPPNTGTRYIASKSVPTTTSEEIARVDHQFSDKTSLMVHYLHEANTENLPTSLWNNDNEPTIASQFINDPQQAELKLTRSISPTLLNEFMVGFQRQPINVLPTGTYKQPSGLAIQPIFPGTNTDNRIPAIELSGQVLGDVYQGSSWPWDNVLNTWSFRDNVSKITGNHVLTFGGEYMHYLKKQELFGNTQGDYVFNGSATGGYYIGAGGQVLQTPGNEFADFLLGDAHEYTELQDQTTPSYLNNFYGLWTGDTWKARPSLTLDLGLRWEGMPHGYEQYNQIASFRPSLYNAAQAPQINPTNGSIVFGTGNLLNGMGIAGQNGVPQGLVDDHWKLFEPRIGFAWTPFHGQKTVIRGGYGLFYENIQGNDLYNTAPNPPFSNTPQIFNTTLTNPGGVTGTVFPSSLVSLNPNYDQPQSQEWSFGFQRQLNQATVFSLMYVGSKGTHEQITSNLNQPTAPIGSAQINAVRPYVGWANINWLENATNSNYNSLQASLRFAGWHGLTSGVSYTYSHCLSYSNGDASGIDVQNAYNIAAEYSNCASDIRQMLVFNYVYSLPVFSHSTGITRSLLGGWQVSGVTTLYSGNPFSIGYSGDPAECGCSNYRPDLAGNPNSGSGIHTAGEWFNIAAFAAVPTGQFGNSAPMNVRGAAVNDWDVSLFKNFSAIPFPGSKEGASLQFRVEFFNVFNTVMFNSFNTGFGPASSGFGAANGTRDPREMQLGAKFMF